MNLTRYFTFILLACTSITNTQAQPTSIQWPAVSRESKPWTRWWWHGSAVSKEGITAELQAYKSAGIGGVEITPIYGVFGHEKKFVNFLTDEWMELLVHTLKEGERLDMGIDMATGTGWPFGGPWVDEADACKNVEYKAFKLRGGEKLKEKIIFVQQPYLRAVGSQIYEVHDTTISKEPPKGSLKEPLSSGRRVVDIKDLVEPVSANKNLQALALDQVKFEKQLPLNALMAYSNDGQALDLTEYVADDGTLNWTAPKGEWVLYAVFVGWHGKMVERAGPGGEGNVIDHFSDKALTNYLKKFDQAFADSDLKSLRGFFNDSYEVDDARGNADWTPMLFAEFSKRRGYDLRQHLPSLFARDDDEKNHRVLCDYRETISELVLENFTRRWRDWAHKYDAIVRNQAHGSPANILDLYATVDIPEIEGADPLRIKMATSAGHVSGKRLISSESATWMNEHFESTLADIKVAVDRFLLQGVNHILYHGTTYSPPGEPWPGWLFYAAVHLNPRNSLWPHFNALNTYVARTQTILQSTKIDNDVLLYYPIYDRFSTPGEEMIEHFDAVGTQFDGSSFKRAAELMLASGYAFDYISDKQIGNIRVETGRLKTEGGNHYQVILVPKCKYIPLHTMKKLESLANQGATILFFEGLPSSVNGYKDFEASKQAFDEIIAKFQSSYDNVKQFKSGNGKILTGGDVQELLAMTAARRETLVEHGLQFLRKKKGDRAVYFIGNGDKRFNGWIAFEAKGKTAVIYDPMTGKTGVADARTKQNGLISVKVDLAPRQTLIVEISQDQINAQPYRYLDSLGAPLPIGGSWQIKFSEGGPEIPGAVATNTLASWTTFADPSLKSFSGLATYTLSFNKPRQKANEWVLDLGTVKESAEVFLNGKRLGILIGPEFRIPIDNSQLTKRNVLEIKVANLMANRIADLDKKRVGWKKFYNVNFPARKAENRRDGLFDASAWEPRASGLVGPVQLYPLYAKAANVSNR